MVKDDERRRALALLAEHGWYVHHQNAKGYLQVRCGCGKHLHWLPKTPSNRNTWHNKARSFISECSTRPGGVR